MSLWIDEDIDRRIDLFRVRLGAPLLESIRCAGDAFMAEALSREMQTLTTTVEAASRARSAQVVRTSLRDAAGHAARCRTQVELHAACYPADDPLCDAAVSELDEIWASLERLWRRARKPRGGRPPCSPS